MLAPWIHLAPRVPSTDDWPAARLAAELDASAVLRGFAAAATEIAPPLILVNDPQRATATRRVLAALASGAAERSFVKPACVLVATGTHRFDPAARASFEQHVLRASGLPISRIDWHDSTAADELAELGGVVLNRRLAAAKHVLAIGSVEPHYFAGLTGAHKTATIGCLAHAEIERNHAGALSPASEVFALDGNPVHAGIVQVLAGLRAAGTQVLAINQVAAAGRILEVAIGDPLETLMRLAPRARATFAHELAEPVDLLHLRVPAPLGGSLYQADKALKNNHRAVRDAGGIILDVACEQGVGPAAFLEPLRAAPTYRDALALVMQRGYRLGDHKAVKLRYLTDPACRAVRVALVTRNIRPEDAQAAGFGLFPTVPAAIAWIAERVRPLHRAARIEDAGVSTVIVP